MRLDLVLRGHRFVADDVIHVDKLGPARSSPAGTNSRATTWRSGGSGSSTSGTCSRDRDDADEEDGTRDPDRGVGSFQEYDRLGLEDGTVEILGVRLPSLLVPNLPGRNLATIVEVGVRNHLLKQLGVHSAREFVRAPGAARRGGRLR